MGWMQALCETYDNYFNGEPLDDQHPLVPVGFIEKELNIRVNLLPDGIFHSALVLEEKRRLPVPSSPAAEGKTGSTAVPYPLCDELRYVAGDLSEYTDVNHSAYYQAYIEHLRSWCDTPSAPQELRTLLHYLEGKRLVKDLLACGLLFEADGKLLNKRPDKKSKPAFFNLGKPAEKCIVDFAVLTGDSFVPLRQMTSVSESWRRTLLASMRDRQLCYSSGEREPVIYNHAKIEGNAKLISAKDGPRDFQYKGRFLDAEQACSVSYLASAKAHNTLRWLRSRQGFKRPHYGATFLTWSTACREIIDPQDDMAAGWGASDEDEGLLLPRTEQEYANRIKSAMAGYKEAPAYKKGAHIVMLGMEAATPGRMSINYYQELDGSEYLERLNQWYTGCHWLLPHWRGGKCIYYMATPTLGEIGDAVFGQDAMRMAARDVRGEKSVTKQIKSFHADMISCIVSGRPAPVSAARTAFQRTCRPASFTDMNGKWQRCGWLTCLAVTCAMMRSNNQKEEYTVSLNTENTDTSYLFGRLVAVADHVESMAMRDSDNPHRQTNAIRYFSAMQQRPAATWVVLANRLQPYLTKLQGKSGGYYRYLLDSIGHRFAEGELANNKRLSPHFLEGYYNQRFELLNKNS